MPVFWQVMYRLFRWAVRKLYGRGLGDLPLAKRLYIAVATLVVPRRMWKADVGGYSMGIRPELGALSVNLMADGIYEKMTTNAFRASLGEGMVVVDIGANVGYFTLLASSLVGDKGRVLAFEPEPRNYNELVRNIKANGITNVTLYQKAISDKCGYAPMYLSPLEWGEHSLVPCRTEEASDFEVGVVKLDDILRNMPVDLIKIDTEGNEIEVLEGAARTFARNGNVALLIEFWPAGLMAAGHNPHKLWALLEGMGYTHIMTLDEGRGEMVQGRYDEALLRCGEPNSSVNLWCGKKEIKGIV